MHELKCIQAHPMGGTQLAQQLREWRYGHDDAGQLGASSHRKASRTLVEVRCALRTRHVLLRRACVCRCTRDPTHVARSRSYACASSRGASLLDGWSCWSTAHGCRWNSWRPPCGPHRVRMSLRPVREGRARLQTHSVRSRQCQSSRRTPSRTRRLCALSRAVATA